MKRAGAHPWRPWAFALLTAAVFCSTYAWLFLFRSLWQSKNPELAASWANDGSFAVVAMFGTENLQEELAYAGKVKEAAEHLFPFDPFALENRSLRLAVIDHLTYRVMSLAYLLTRDMQGTWLLLRFVCCLLWFVAVYHMALRLSGSPGAAVFAGVFVTCFSYILTFLFVGGWSAQLAWEGSPLRLAAKAVWLLLSYGRTESVYRLPRPGVTYLFLFLAALASVKAAETRGPRWPAIAGVLGGLLAYVRVDVWSAYLGAAFLFALLESVARKRLVLPLWAAAAAASAMSVPWMLVNMPADKELLVRSGAVFGRSFNVWSLPYLAGALVMARRADAPMGRYLAAMLGSMFAILNVQLAVGYALEPEHWTYFGNIFFFLCAFAFVPESWKQRSGRWHAAAVLLLAATFLQGVGYAALHFPFSGLKRDYESALAWLRGNSERESVVLALNPEANYLVPAFTDNKVVLATRYLQISDLPLEENARRLALALRALGADRDKFTRENLLRGPGQYVDTRGFRERGEIEKDGFLDRHLCVPAHGEDCVRKVLAALERQPGPADPAVRVDYVWVGAFERDYVGADFPRGAGIALQEVYRNPSVTLYQTAAPYPLR